MALEKFGFIVCGEDFEQVQPSQSFYMKVVGVKQLEDAITVAKTMVDEGIQLIELCGGFSPVIVGKLIEAIDGAVPVGVVAYGPESIDGMYKLFAD